MAVSGVAKAIYASLGLVIVLQVAQRLGAGHGLAALRQDDGALVQHEGARASSSRSGTSAHNVGGGLVATFALSGVMLFGDWGAKFYFNAAIAAAVAVVAFFLMRDTPQSYGLPPVEEYKNDYPPDYSADDERTFTLPGDLRRARAEQPLSLGDCRRERVRLFRALRRGELDSDLPADGERLLVQPVEHRLGALRVGGDPRHDRVRVDVRPRLQGPARAGDHPLHVADARRGRRLLAERATVRSGSTTRRSSRSGS